MTAQDWRQVPVHTAIMLGQGAIAEIGIDGYRDAKMYFKEKEQEIFVEIYIIILEI